MDTGTVKIFSAEECLKIVRKTLQLNESEEIRLQSYEVKRGSKDLVGFMGEYFKLFVYLLDKHNATKCLNYFVKSVPISNEYHKNECERKGFFGKETRIYTEILPNIQKYAPTKLYPVCYYTRADLIVLEDLSTSPEGFRHLNDNESYTNKHHRLVLDHLAKLHAASIAWERKNNFSIGERFKDVLFEMHMSMKNEWFVTGIKGICYLAKRVPKFQTPETLQFIDEKLYALLCKSCVLVDPSKKYRNVLCHRDTWDRNIFYQFDDADTPIDCRIVDFQLTRYCPPPVDIMFFLHVTTSREERATDLKQHLDYYYESLRCSLRHLNVPENLITIQEFVQSCRGARLAALIMLAICEPLMKMPKGLANKMRAEEPFKFDHYMNSDRTEMFLRVMKFEPSYEKTIMTPIEELIEFIMENEDILM